MLKDGVKMINQALASSTSSPADRMIVCETTETLLRAAGCYFGHRLLYAHEVPDGQAPGKYPESNHGRKIDHTRREYCIEPTSDRDR